MPRKTMTIRLEESTRRRLTLVARRRGRTPSAIVRAAIDEWLTAESGPAAGGPTPYETVADLIGSVHGGDPERSVGGPRRIAAVLRQRRDARAR
jgi:Ribbon-helix-helix protein, copG family